MASKGMMTGMQGVFLVAAELSRRGFIVSTTSRNALGADLFVTDQRCQRTWSVQVKTNSRPASYWLTGEKARETKSPMATASTAQRPTVLTFWSSMRAMPPIQRSPQKRGRPLERIVRLLCQHPRCLEKRSCRSEHACSRSDGGGILFPTDNTGRTVNA
jgi:hypothetical protein